MEAASQIFKYDYYNEITPSIEQQNYGVEWYIFLYDIL